MFAPTKTWRRWHRRVNLKQKRYAVCSALAASAVPSLLMARGHAVETVPEVPLIIDEASEAISKTAKAVALLKSIGAYADIEKVKDSRNIRSGKGKMRNRRYVQRKGPLVVYDAHAAGAAPALVKAMRNIPGVELCAVDRLGLLTLAPAATSVALSSGPMVRSRSSTPSTAPRLTRAPRRRAGSPPPTSWPCPTCRA